MAHPKATTSSPPRRARVCIRGKISQLIFDTAKTLAYVAEVTQNEGHQSATQIVGINILERDIHYEQK